MQINIMSMWIGIMFPTSRATVQDANQEIDLVVESFATQVTLTDNIAVQEHPENLELIERSEASVSIWSCEHETDQSWRQESEGALRHGDWDANFPKPARLLR